MLNVNVILTGAEVVSFNRLEGTKIKVHFKVTQDKNFDFIYKSTDPELAVMELMRQLKLYVRRSVKESEEEMIQGVNVMFSDEEKTAKTFTRFFTTLNEKLYYLKAAKNAQEHMTLLQGLLNLKFRS